jgi:hypothetical protein
MKEETVRDDYEAPRIRAYGTMQSIVQAGGSKSDRLVANPKGIQFTNEPNLDINFKVDEEDFGKPL